VRLWAAKADDSRNPARGVLHRELRVLNQNDVIVCEIQIAALWARRSALA
jgi:hypothetical protein